MKLLNDKNIFPDEKVLQNELGKLYKIYADFANKIVAEPLNLVTEWRYYNDGKSWLCKITFKKKTIIWLSVWENCFKTSFYFTEKNSVGIPALEINQEIKDNFEQAKKNAIGKLIPLLIEVNSENQIADILKIAEYKKKIK
jgi:hypothetical protein